MERLLNLLYKNDLLALSQNKKNLHKKCRFFCICQKYLLPLQPELNFSV